MLPVSGATFCPAVDRVLVRPEPVSDPVEASLDDVLRGTVVAVEDGRSASALFRIGDVVLYQKYDGLKVTLGEGEARETFLLLWTRDIAGVFR